MNKLVGEPVAVNQGIPHFLPEFENPIYTAAVVNREQVIKRICMGDCKGNLSFLIKSIGGLQFQEIEQILSSWQACGLVELMELYNNALRDNAIDKIQKVDGLLREDNLGETYKIR